VSYTATGVTLKQATIMKWLLRDDDWKTTIIVVS